MLIYLAGVWKISQFHTWIAIKRGKHDTAKDFPVNIKQETQQKQLTHTYTHTPLESHSIHTAAPCWMWVYDSVEITVTVLLWLFLLLFILVYKLLLLLLVRCSEKYSSFVPTTISLCVCVRYKTITKTRERKKGFQFNKILKRQLWEAVHVCEPVFVICIVWFYYNPTTHK